MILKFGNIRVNLQRITKWVLVKNSIILYEERNTTPVAVLDFDDQTNAEFAMAQIDSALNITTLK